jgi:hypothetical protein
MRVALLHTFAASKKEPLAAMLDRVHQAFRDSGLGEPVIRFNFGDPQVGGGVSSVARVLKRFPDLERFVTTKEPMSGMPAQRRISNGPLSEGAGQVVAYSTLQAIAAGVPRSFPFHSVVFHFHTPEFGDVIPTALKSAEMMPGVQLSDSWWVNGRNRSLTACTVVEADPASKKMPPPAAAVATVLASCGKIRRTVQAPLADKNATELTAVRLPTGMAIPSANPEALRAVHSIVVEYRARMKEVVERAALPHQLLPVLEALRATPRGASSGPRKPALERVFKPVGYSCRGESGTFTLSRRTAANLTLELHLDVGTWSHMVRSMFRVWGLGFKALLILPVSATDVVGAQYPIGDSDQWQKIVENLAALVAELERSFVLEIEKAAGPSPEWYKPQT